MSDTRIRAESRSLEVVIDCLVDNTLYLHSNLNSSNTDDSFTMAFRTHFESLINSDS